MGLRVDLDVAVTMPDGAQLIADIVRPDTAAAVPVILVRTPYGKASGRSYGLAAIEAAREGFAFVTQDVRGRGASSGQFLPLGGALETDDGVATVDWLVDQPWCDGAVGMIGSSYVAVTQQAAAVGHPAGLRAIAPSQAGSPRVEATYTLDTQVALTALFMLDKLDALVASGAMTAEQAADIVAGGRNPQKACALPNGAEPRAAQAIGGTVEEMLAALRGLFEAPSVQVPALCTTGWFDFYGPATVGNFQQMRANAGTAAAREGSALVIGHWGHGDPTPTTGQWFFGVEQIGVTGENRLRRAHLDFYRRHLLGEAVNVPTVQYFLMGHNTWQTATSWPPEGATAQVWYLHSSGKANSADGDGVLDRESPGQSEPIDRYTDNAKDPVPSLGGRPLYFGGTPVGPHDQVQVERRADLLVYTSPPLEDELTIAGDLRAVVYVSSTSPSLQIVAKLCDVTPAGASFSLIDGITRVDCARDGAARTVDAPIEVRR